MHDNYKHRICQLISNNTSILKRVEQTLGINQPFDNQLSKNKNITFLRNTGEQKNLINSNENRMNVIEEEKREKKLYLYGGNTKAMRSPCINLF